MRLVTEETIPCLQRELTFNVLHLFAVTSPAPVNVRFRDKVLVRGPMADNALYIHESVLAILPYLGHIAVTFITFLVFRCLYMFFFCGQYRGRKDEKNEDDD
jgi:hypothetical protein